MARRTAKMIAVYEDHGIRFQYPNNWALEVSDEGPARTTVEVQAPGGLAFVLVTVDEERPEPTAMADEALDAMREEYPGLDAAPAQETMSGHRATGYDLEFISLDMLNSCVIRAFRTPRQTVLVFGQWSDLASGDPERLMLALRRSLEETDE